MRALRRNPRHFISPPFPGVVKAVKKRLGDKIEQGEILAVVESNESLRTYNITSEIAGTVIQKDVSLGEFVKDDKAILTVADHCQPCAKTIGTRCVSTA